jgi:hypothetical protein
MSKSCPASMLVCVSPIRTGIAVSASTSSRLTQPSRFLRSCRSWMVWEEGVPRDGLSLEYNRLPETDSAKLPRLESPTRSFRICILTYTACSQKNPKAKGDSRDVKYWGGEVAILRRTGDLHLDHGGDPSRDVTRGIYFRTQTILAGI